MADILVDTNVLVYAHDLTEPVKRQQALDVLDRLVAANVGFLSTQVLAEFYNTVTRKLKPPLEIAEATDQMQRFIQVWTVLLVTPQVILEAVRGVQAYTLSFWDALIWAVARLNGIGVVFSEDFNDGATIEDVRFVNPFAPDFDAKQWGL
ncbi:MAG TPA: PIN domain-containing protein [Anaerolineae bacterium]|nr:PIN domain-containing protein [Anaerolineae bacterium]